MVMSLQKVLIDNFIFHPCDRLRRHDVMRAIYSFSESYLQFAMRVVASLCAYGFVVFTIMVYVVS